MFTPSYLCLYAIMGGDQARVAERAEVGSASGFTKYSQRFRELNHSVWENCVFESRVNNNK
jgi:hypothetical protein